MCTAAWNAEQKEGGRGDGRDEDGDRLNWCEDNVANIPLGTEPNTPLSYTPVLEIHHLITSMIGDI